MLIYVYSRYPNGIWLQVSINKYENILELYLDIDVSSSLTVLSNYTQLKEF